METITKETHIIYKTVDVTTGEYYIGLHSWRGDQEPYEYWGNYGEQWNPDPKNLVRITLAEYQDRETLKDKEVEWIGRHLGDLLCKNRHNRRLAYDMWDKNHTQESRDRMRESKLGKPSGNKGWKHTEEARAKMRKPRSEQGRKNISEGMMGKIPWNKGKKASEEARAKMRKPKSKEARENMRHAQLGKTQPKVACCYCNRLIGNTNITRHQKACKEKSFASKVI